MTVDLKVVLLNAENLFLLSDQRIEPSHLSLDSSSWKKLSTSVADNKPLEKLKDLARALREINPDLVLFTEIGGIESLQNFGRLFLNEEYSAALIEGNSDRNIDVGFLIRKNLGFYFDVLSNKTRPLNFLYPHEKKQVEEGFSLIKNGKPFLSHRFSRDASELHLFKGDRERPFAIFLLTHLKSQLDPENIDPNGCLRRRAEASTLVEIYKELQAKHSEACIIVAGDFNGNASSTQTDEEFAPIYSETELRDVLELAQIPSYNRWTYYQVSRASKPEGKQIDYVFLNLKAQALLEVKNTFVFRYKNNIGVEIDPPFNMELKTQLPSDHYPLVFQLKQLPLW